MEIEKSWSVSLFRTEKQKSLTHRTALKVLYSALTLASDRGLLLLLYYWKSLSDAANREHKAARI